MNDRSRCGSRRDMHSVIAFSFTARRVSIVAALIVCAVAAGCPGARSHPRSYPVPAADEILAHLAATQQRARSYRAESVMDYWVDGERVKGTVLLMGRTGARLRINALTPAGDTVAADLACDGIGFEYIDYRNDCQLTGACTRNSIAELLRISLEPDDFLLMVMGSTPVIPDAQGSVTWDASKGHEVVQLTTPDNRLTQTIVLDGRDRRWDVLSSVVRDARGNVLWSLENKDMETLQAEDGAVFRVPAKTRLEQPQENADLLVRWGKRTFNLAVDEAKFDMDIPAGLRACR